jgi:hypothetical protein
LEGEIILDSQWFMKDEKAIDWKEGFSQFLLNKEIKVKYESWKFEKKRIFYFLFF